MASAPSDLVKRLSGRALSRLLPRTPALTLTLMLALILPLIPPLSLAPATETGRAGGTGHWVGGWPCILYLASTWVEARLGIDRALQPGPGE
jgi:hypothetical protein